MGATIIPLVHPLRSDQTFSPFRHNTGLANKGQYLMMAITLGAVNRIPTAHLRFLKNTKHVDFKIFRLVILLSSNLKMLTSFLLLLT